MTSETAGNSGVLTFGRIIALVSSIFGLFNFIAITYYILSEGGAGAYILFPISRLLLITISVLIFFLAKSKSRLLLFSSIYSGAYLFLALLVTLIVMTVHDDSFSFFQDILGVPFREGFSIFSLRVAFGIEVFDSGLDGLVGRIFNLTSTMLFFCFITFIVVCIVLLASKSGETNARLATPKPVTQFNNSVSSSTSTYEKQSQAGIDDQARRLEQFGRLFKDGLITKEEFEEKKREILGK